MAHGSTPIRLLIVEDVESDALLALRALRGTGQEYESLIVETAGGFKQALDDFSPQVILSDFSMPHFNGIEALMIAQELKPAIPFIFVSGMLGEEHAIRALKYGATDYVLKGNLLRLPAAVERALHEAEQLAERNQLETQLREREAEYRQLIEQAGDGIYSADHNGNFTLVNTRGCELLGYAAEEIVGMNVIDTYIPTERLQFQERLGVAVKGQSLRFERTVLRKDGSTFPAEIGFKVLPSGMIQGIFHDISARRQNEERILRLQRIYAVLSSISSAIVRINDRQELFIEACRIAVQHAAFHIAWIGLIDHESNSLKPAAWAGDGSDIFTRIIETGSKLSLSKEGIANRAVSERRTVFENNITADSNLDVVRKAAVDIGCKSAIGLPLMIGGEPIGMFMLYCDEENFFDAEEIKLLENLAGDVSFSLTFIAQREKAEFLAHYDTLTGLPNRALFFDLLARKMGSMERQKSNVSLILFNLDRFRMINDALGRAGGDLLLRALTERLRTMTRDDDILARIGADSFAVAFSGIWSVQDIAYSMETRRRKIFGLPFNINGEEMRASASAGIALAPNDGETPEALFSNAEAALRNAKSEKELFLFYNPEMNVRVADTVRMENELRRALENGELVLWYQPKVSLKTGKVTGLEALMRWQHPESGMIPPAQFIPLMEQTGLILDAGNWALSQVARDCAQWTAQGIKSIHIAVNVSPLQLRAKNFVATVVEAAGLTEAAGGQLDLEITESVIMENVDAIIPILQTIRGLGVEISVDDFGTGYSSLAYIARLPIHALKIDRSFVVGMTQNQDSLAIVRSVISLAHALRLRVVAEGVETAEQAKLLSDLSCDEYQGYLFGRPVPAGEVPEAIKNFSQL